MTTPEKTLPEMFDLEVMDGYALNRNGWELSIYFGIRFKFMVRLNDAQWQELRRLIPPPAAPHAAATARLREYLSLAARHKTHCCLTPGESAALLDLIGGPLP